MHKITKNYKPLTQTFYEDFITYYLNGLINEIITKDAQTSSYKSIEKSLADRKEGIINGIEEEISDLTHDDEFLRCLFQKLQRHASKILNDFCEELQNITYLIYNKFYSCYKGVLSEFGEILSYEDHSKLDKMAENITKLIDKEINALNEAMHDFLTNELGVMKKFRENIYNHLNKELLYDISTFTLFSKLKRNFIKSKDKDQKYKVLKLKGAWINEKNGTSLHQCIYEILNEINIPVKDKNVRKVLLNVLKCNEVLEDILSESNIIKYYERLEKNHEESKKFLFSILCKHFKYENKDSLSKMLDVYFLPVLSVIEDRLHLSTSEKLDLLKQLMINRKSILDLEIFGYLSKLGFPSAMNIEILEESDESIGKTVMKPAGEIDVITLCEKESSKILYLIEITTERDLDQKIEELRQKVEKASFSLQIVCKGILIHAEDRRLEERGGILLIPFTACYEELQKYLSKST
jgi:hypothetical protein